MFLVMSVNTPAPAEAASNWRAPSRSRNTSNTTSVKAENNTTRVIDPSAVTSTAVVVSIEGRESRRQGNLRRRYAIAVECRFEEERDIVVDLQRVARADFIEDKKAPIPSPNHEWLGRERAVGQANARGDVVFGRGRQVLRITGSPRRNEDSLRVIPIALAILGFVNRCRIVPAQPKVQRQLRRCSVSILNERPVRVLAIAEIYLCRNDRCDRQPHQHVSQAVAAAISQPAGIGGELAAKRQVPAGLADLQKVELVKVKLRSKLEQVLPVHNI